MKAYLAGPEVFSENAQELGKVKSQICQDFGFTPLFPMDNEIIVSGDKAETAAAIRASNKQMMREADIIIANLSPFRGPSADAGTVYEVGFMEGLGKPVFAYSNDPRNFFERSQSDFGSERLGVDTEGMLIEDFDQNDNLMLTPLQEEGVFIVSDVKKDIFDLAAFQVILKIAAERLLDAPKPA